MVKGLEVEQRRQQVVQGLLAHKTLRQIHAELVGDTERTVRCSLATGGRDALAMRQEWAAARTGTVHELVAEELGNVGHLYTNVFCHAFADAWPASGGQEGDLMRLADAHRRCSAGMVPVLRTSGRARRTGGSRRGIGYDRRQMCGARIR